jgi:hypothetical protein
MRIRRTLTVVATAVFSSIVLFAIPQSAWATAINKSCSSHGFTAWITLRNVSPGWDYRINKGSNSGGNHANVDITNGNALPPSTWNSPDSLVQDNAYHSLGYLSGETRNYGVLVIFDLANNPDPRCSIQF